jgi:hypothetical protein
VSILSPNASECDDPFGRAESLSTAGLRSVHYDDVPWLGWNPTKDLGRALLSGASRGMGFNERHSVAASFEHLMGEKIDEDMTRTSPHRGHRKAKVLSTFPA